MRGKMEEANEINNPPGQPAFAKTTEAIPGLVNLFVRVVFQFALLFNIVSVGSFLQ